MHLTHSRRSRRLITALAVAAASALTLAGCSSGSGSSTSGDAVTVPKTDPKATIKVLSILDLKSDNMQPVVDAFEKAHPSIKVKWQTVPFDSLNSTVDSRVSGVR